MNRKIIFIFAVTLVIAIALSLAASSFPVLPFDEKVAWELQKEEQPLFVVSMYVVSQLGQPIPAITMMLLVATFFAVIRYWLEGFFVLATSSGVIVDILMKLLIGRRRPSEEFETLQGFFHTIDQYSFPSGHVVFFVVFFGFVAYLVWKRFASWVRWIFIGICAFLIILIGPSRVFLNAHWASDVVGGYLVGGLLLYVLILAYQRTRNHLKASV